MANDRPGKYFWNSLNIVNSFSGLLALAISCFALTASWKANDYSRKSNEIAEQAHSFAQHIWKLDQEKQALKAVPVLRYIEGSKGFQDGIGSIIVRNEAKDMEAIVTRVSFVITDPDQLRKLETIRPRPKPDQPITWPLSVIDSDQVEFRSGNWIGNNYQFRTHVTLTVLPQSSNAFTFHLWGDEWKGQKFTGRIVLKYDGGLPCEIPAVTVRWHQDKRRADLGPMPAPLSWICGPTDQSSNRT